MMFFLSREFLIMISPARAGIAQHGGIIDVSSGID
jgi:hypothetical protein